VPGRIEVLGKHTDYAGGRSLLCAVERAICIVARPRRDRTVRLVDADSGDIAEFPLAPDLLPPLGSWTNYPMTVARRMARDFAGVSHGIDAALASDLPRAAGLSSSSALVVGIFFALADVNELAARPEYQRNLPSPEDLAAYLGAVENGRAFGGFRADAGVGTAGGSEDHTAILCCRDGELSQFSFVPVRRERNIPLPSGHLFAVAVSGVVAEKTGAALERYNRAADLVAELLKRWKEATRREDQSLPAALASAPDAAAGLIAGAGAPLLRDRLEQFVAESGEIVPGAGDALARGDFGAFGRLVDRSQDLAERLLGNQTPETVALTRTARVQGALAASAFGAGFGGSVWALIPEPGAGEWLSRWSASYRAAFPARGRHAAFFLTAPGPAFTRVL